MEPRLYRMAATRPMITLLVLAAYEPIFYWGLYRPVVVPSLPRWEEIPSWIVCAAMAPYAIGVLSLGLRAGALERLGYSTCLAIAHWSFAHLMYSQNQPGYLKAEGFEWAMLFLAIGILFCTMCGGAVFYRIFSHWFRPAAKRSDAT